MVEKPAQQHPPGGYPARSAEAYRGPVALLNATGGRYVEVPSDATTPLEGFCNILSLMPVREGKVVEPSQLDLDASGDRTEAGTGTTVTLDARRQCPAVNLRHPEMLVDRHTTASPARVA